MSHRTALVSCVALASVVGVAVLGWVGRSELADTVHVLSSVSLPALAIVLGAELLATTAQAGQQRLLLADRGQHVPMRTALATTFSGNAITAAVPLAGSTLGAVFEYRTYVGAGADAVKVVVSLLLSSVVSSLAFVGIAEVGVLLAGGHGDHVISGLTSAAGAVALGVLLGAIRSTRLRPALRRAVVTTVSVVQRMVRRPGDPGSSVDRLFDQIDALHIRDRVTRQVLSLSTLMWLADLAAFVVAFPAVGLGVPWHSVIVVWMLAAGASSIGLTPGGLGVVEATLVAGLVSVGVPATGALAVTLTYRVGSLWCTSAVGWSLLLLGRHGRWREDAKPLQSADTIEHRTPRAPVVPPAGQLALLPTPALQATAR